jgi:hypothetical protein
VSALEDRLSLQIRGLKLPAPEREHAFAAHHVGPGRGVRERLARAGLKNWRFDFAWPELMFAVEVEGGQWTGGRHTRGKGFTEDIEKYHHAMRLGWTVYRCERRLIECGEAVGFIEKFLTGRMAA